MQLKERETDEIFTIGTIDLSDCDDLVNEGYRGSFGNGLNNCEIKIRGNEGSIPHCHVISSDGKWQCCPCLYEPLYFNHAEYQGKFIPKQKKKFNDWMMQPCKDDPNVSNWKMLCIIWGFANGDPINIPKHPKQPDYTKLENMIG